MCIYICWRHPLLKGIWLQKFLFFGVDWKPNDIPPSYGILPMILGSIYVTFGAIIIGVPIGVLTATYLAKFCNKKNI